jgi:hypothetical protein
MSSLLNFAPTNSAFGIDADGRPVRMSGAFQIWLRELWLRTGGLNQTTNDNAALAGAFFLAGSGDGDGEQGPPGPPGATGATGAQGEIGPALFMFSESGDSDGGMVIPGPEGPAGSANVQTFTLAADESTAADTTPISLTDLAWDFEAGATYAFRIIGNVSPNTATTGIGLHLRIT